MSVTFNAIAPTFLVEDVVRAAEYYRERLGFEVSPYFGDPPVFTIVRRGETRIGLRGCQGTGGRTNRKVLSDSIDAYIWIDGLDELHRELADRGADIALAPVTRVYGLREFEVRDADGYVVCFGEFLKDSKVEETPHFDQVNVIARDVRASLAFYRRLGVAFDEPSTTVEPFHVNGSCQSGTDFDLDSPAFAQVWNRGWAARSDLVGRVVLGFGVNSREAVDKIYAELTTLGHHGLQEPFDAFWGARYAVVEDPNGVAVGFMSPMDPRRRTPLPEPWQR